MDQRIHEIQKNLEKIIKGKKEITDKILMAILARGHVLLEDVPGVGKTTTALSFSKLMGMDFRRIQFTPDVVPSDVTGFTMFDKQLGQFKYTPGAVMCNMLLADEINRTSSKTQSALLEVMEEGQVTVDGVTHDVPTPFVVIATQNPMGTAGTQMLPESQLDRFMVKLSMGYPDQASQLELLRERQNRNPLNDAMQAVSPQEVSAFQQEVQQVHMSDPLLQYVTDLTESTRNHALITLGVSPRGALALCRMAKAAAYLHARDYVVPADVNDVFVDVCSHRLVLNPKAKLENRMPADILREVLKNTPEPKIG